MKHIFTVHSPITYFSALNVVFHDKLCSDDVIFLCSGYYPDSNVGKVVPSVSDKDSSIFRKIKNLNVAKASDQYISFLTENKPFTAYIDLAHYYQKLLITHHLCSMFHFIEEGTASYLAPNDLNELTRIEKGNFRTKTFTKRIQGILRILRGYSLKSLALPYFANSFSSVEGIRFYGFHENAYPGVPKEKKVVLNPHTIKSDRTIKIENPLAQESIILIEESYFRAYNIGAEEVKRCFKKSMNWLNGQVNDQKVYVKLRPRQRKSDSLWIMFAENMNINFTILADEPLENSLALSSNCKVVGTVSSLLYYAAIFGHEAYSNYGFIESRPKSSFDYADYFWDKVHLIKEV